jgi:hypothetical protein
MYRCLERRWASGRYNVYWLVRGDPHLCLTDLFSARLRFYGTQATKTKLVRFYANTVKILSNVLILNLFQDSERLHLSHHWFVLAPQTPPQPCRTGTRISWTPEIENGA